MNKGVQKRNRYNTDRNPLLVTVYEANQSQPYRETPHPQTHLP